ncbi:hypothetical protein F4678DRAFT_482038 [Xylaria arbuscula]|nr:hypothetical protein F4678DRAFT_482038 [Xylaria arbuscula]
MTVISSPRELNSQTSATISANEAIHGRLEPGPATGGRFYNDDEQPPSIIFKFCPDTTKRWNIPDQDWIASIQLKCSNVPRLMREGFYWDKSNVINEEGYIENGTTNATAPASKREFTRWYFLTDIYQPRRWIASLAVTALDKNILYNFNLNQLSREKIRLASAVNQNKKQIYGYRSFTSANKSTATAEIPMMGFNMIYDNMPMKGFWPWPKEKNTAHTKDRAEEGKGEARVVGKGSVSWLPYGNSRRNGIMIMNSYYGNFIGVGKLPA